METAVCPAGSRAMVVNKLIRRNSGGLCLGFHDSCISFDIPKNEKERYKLENIAEGQTLYIKGRLGNEDVMLASPDALTDLIVAK